MIEMGTMANDLRHLHEYASNHRVYSLDLLLRAADHIERLEAQIEETRQYFDEEDRRVREHFKEQARQLAGEGGR
jgi:hypothetical protein